jgi:hypothetical protein
MRDSTTNPQLEEVAATVAHWVAGVLTVGLLIVLPALKILGVV